MAILLLSPDNYPTRRYYGNIVFSVHVSNLTVYQAGGERRRRKKSNKKKYNKKRSNRKKSNKKNK
jgi:hypothetical protein